MSTNNFQFEHVANHQYLSQKLGEDYHSTVYMLLFYIVCGSTIKLLLLFKSPAIYKRILDRIFKIKVTLFKQEFTLYFAMLIWIFILMCVFYSIFFI